MDDKAKELLEFQIRKDTVYLYKRLLGMVEDMRDEHLFMMDKLQKALPPQFHIILDSCNLFDENKFGYIRKKILDAGNESLRNTTEQLKQFNVTF